MSLGNRLMVLGQWFEKHFPEKLTAAEVHAKVALLENGIADSARGIQSHNELFVTLIARIVELERKSELFNSDINKTKVMLLTQRQNGR